MKCRILSFFICLTVIFNWPLPCFGDDTMTVDTSFDTKAYVLHALEAVRDSISLTDHPMTSKEAVRLYQELLETQPQLFYVKPTISYAFDSQGFVTALYPAYTMSPEAVLTARREIKTYIDTFLLKRDESMSEGDLALLIHDHLAASYTYSPQGPENYDIYTMMTDGHGVCQAFSLMYVLLGRSMDLEVDMVTSLPMDHAWNHVKIDGVYYHVDVTRDLSQENGLLTHGRFLLSDLALERLGYHGYTCHDGHSCIDHGYEISLDGELQYESVFSSVVGSSLYLGVT